MAHIGLGGGKNEFEEDGRIFFRLGEGDNAVGEEVVRPEAEGSHHVEVADDVRNQFLGALVIAEVVAQEGGIPGLEFARGHFAVALEKFVGVEELSARRLGQLEAFRRVNFPERAKDAVADRFFGMSENVEAADP